MAYETIDVFSEINLEQLKLADAERLFSLVDSDRVYLSKFLPWPEKTKSVNDSLEFIKRMIQRRTEGEEYGYAIKYNAAIVGHISLMHLKEKRPEIGYWIASAYGGKGITTLAAEALTGFAFNTLGVDSIAIRADPDNIGSNKVAQKCGYTFDRTYVDEDGKKLNEWVLSNGHEYKRTK